MLIINHPFRSCTDSPIGVSAPGRPFFETLRESFETRRLLGPKLSSATRFPSSASSAPANKATTCGEMFFLYVLLSEGNKNIQKLLENGMKWMKLRTLRSLRYFKVVLKVWKPCQHMSTYQCIMIEWFPVNGCWCKHVEICWSPNLWVAMESCNLQRSSAIVCGQIFVGTPPDQQLNDMMMCDPCCQA